MTATSDIVFRMNPDWSEMWEIEGKMPASETMGAARNWLNEYIHLDDQPEVSAAIAAAVKTKTFFELEHRVKRTDGTFGWTLSRAVPLLDQHGQLVEWFGAARDVTARHAVEETLREGDRRKNEFLATLAHELRNPLAPLRNGLEIARREARAGTPFQRTIAIMDRQLNHLVHLVDDLLDVGRISTGKIELRRERVNLRSVMEASAEACRAALEKNGHTFIVDTGAEALLAEGDPTG